MVAKKSATLEFTRLYLREKPEASFAEIRDAAAVQELKIYPIVFGRAKALEGLVKVAPYGSKKRERERKAAAKIAAANSAANPAEHAVGTAADSVSGHTVDAVITGMRQSLQERERYRAALLKISAILDELL